MRLSSVFFDTWVGHLSIFFCKMVYNCNLFFLMGCLSFFKVICRNYLYILGGNLSSVICIANNFSHSSLASHSPTGIFSLD